MILRTTPWNISLEKLIKVRRINFIGISSLPDRICDIYNGADNVEFFIKNYKLRFI